MSWTSKLGNLGRFSPFTRSGHSSARVSDSDFSYITADDLRQHQDEMSRDQQSRHGMSESPTDYGPKRDTDVLILKSNNSGREYAVHFAAYSIAKGELSVQKIREEAAKKAHTKTSRVRLYYKGKQLKDDSRTARHEGLRDGSELLLSVSDDDSSGESGDDDLDGTTSPTGEEGQRKRRNRGKKSKRKNRREAAREAESGTSTPDYHSTPNPNLGVPLSQASTHTGGSRTGSRAPSPKPPGTPLTALDKLNELHDKLSSYRPEVDNFLRNPPAEQSKRDFEHKKLSETILTQVLLKTDAVETEGDADARTRRKELVKETQGVLNELDAAMKK